MANTVIEFQEIRCDLRNPELTQCYVFIKNLSNDGMLGVEGWHHKTFPASMAVVDVVQSFKIESPLLWPLKAPD